MPAPDAGRLRWADLRSSTVDSLDDIVLAAYEARKDAHKTGAWGPGDPPAELLVSDEQFELAQRLLREEEEANGSLTLGHAHARIYRENGPHRAWREEHAVLAESLGAKA